MSDSTSVELDSKLRGRIAEVVKEAGEDGAAAWWRPCTGCHETEDGHSVGRYHFSRTFKCEAGSGCHECGGLGVIWDYHSARDLADLEQQLSEPEPLDEAAIRADERGKCANWHNQQAARHCVSRNLFDRHADDQEERDAWRTHKRLEDAHRSYAVAILAGRAE
jgi:hypothetical protein